MGRRSGRSQDAEVESDGGGTGQLIYVVLEGVVRVPGCDHTSCHTPTMGGRCHDIGMPHLNREKEKENSFASFSEYEHDSPPREFSTSQHGI